jgi:hypothetical protein
MNSYSKDRKIRIINRWLIGKYTANPALAIAQSAANEISDAEESFLACDEDLLITCVKTGKPIGVLFKSAANSSLPISLSPNWLRSDGVSLEKHLEIEPLALLNYVIIRAAWGGAANFQKACQEFFNLDRQDYSSIVNEAQKMRAGSYSLLTTFPPNFVAYLLTLTNDLINFLKYETHIHNGLLPIGRMLLSFDNPESGVEVETRLIELISNAYLSKFDGYLKPITCDALDQLDDIELVQAMDSLAITIRSKLMGPNEALPTSVYAIFDTKVQIAKQKKENMAKNFDFIGKLFDQEESIIADSESTTLKAPARNLFDAIFSGDL